MIHLANTGSIDHVSRNAIIIREQFWNGRGKIDRDLFEITFRYLPGGKGETTTANFLLEILKGASSEYKSVMLSDWTKC
jgi:hypothetical protein